MNIDFTPFFKQYEELSRKADSAFKRVSSEYQECVRCKVGCSDCCHALFDLTLIEAIYINHKFNTLFNGEKRDKLIEKANETDRKVYKIKRKAYKELESGKNENDILAEMAQEKVRCPLLNDQEKCDMYEYRPITCRFYGIPTSIGGQGYTCGESGFVKGKQYPTVNLDMIHKELYTISGELAGAVQSKYSNLSEILVPLSMALLTVYDEEYLGLKKEEENK